MTDNTALCPWKLSLKRLLLAHPLLENPPRTRIWARAPGTELGRAMTRGRGHGKGRGHSQGPPCLAPFLFVGASLCWRPGGRCSLMLKGLAGRGRFSGEFVSFSSSLICKSKQDVCKTAGGLWKLVQGSLINLSCFSVTFLPYFMATEVLNYQTALCRLLSHANKKKYTAILGRPRGARPVSGKAVSSGVFKEPGKVQPEAVGVGVLSI